MARGLHAKPETTPERAAYYEDIAPHSMTPLWEVLHTMLRPEPVSAAVPHLWHYDALRPQVLESGNLITAEEAERRVLILENPGLKGKSCVSDALFAGLQLIMPGETAPCHRHSPAALRFIVEGSGAYTAINGEKAYMEPGDLILTPSGVWHDHGNDGDEPVVWLDGLDIPLVSFLSPVFLELYGEGKSFPADRQSGDNMARYGANMVPMGETFATGNSPVFHYPYDKTRAALLEMHRSGETDPCHGIKMEYINPTTGGPVMPTLSTFMQFLPKGFTTETYQSTAAWIYAVVEGEGRTMVGDETLEWGPRDIFVVPAWLPHHHEASADSFAFSFSDRGLHQKLGLYRERRGNQTN
jgi:gentisate 1,2-dioxygenase